MSGFSDILSAAQLPSSTGTPQNDIAGALGGAVQAAATNALQAVAANYQKVFNPNTNSWQAVSGNTPTGGQPANTQVTSLAAMGGSALIGAWIKEHPFLTAGAGLLGLAGLFFGARAVFKKK